ncbi:MAG: hypothetical protein JW855_04500 [Gammaproteobacteria bacterium]|nr:hypothetical protein [Gammaproteobacteria bacterium]
MKLKYEEKRGYWISRVTSWYLSGQSLTLFCKKQGLNKQKMKYGFYRLNLPRPIRKLDAQLELGSIIDFIKTKPLSRLLVWRMLGENSLT